MGPLASRWPIVPRVLRLTKAVVPGRVRGGRSHWVWMLTRQILIDKELEPTLTTVAGRSPKVGRGTYYRFWLPDHAPKIGEGVVVNHADLFSGWYLRQERVEAEPSRNVGDGMEAGVIGVVEVSHLDLVRAVRRVENEAVVNVG